jgi:hypothetical protein
MWVANRLLYTGFVGRHVHLGNMMDADAAHAYRSRISAADVAVYAFVTLSLVGFTVCAVLAYKYEPFYSTAIGMCLGRCHNRVRTLVGRQRPSDRAVSHHGHGIVDALREIC